ncbi:MAG: hypothetical protein VX217_05780, partial [Acidobacteriota bacterium]|nr:hypothetical protein [Acidobacteriota bacterium]
IFDARTERLWMNTDGIKRDLTSGRMYVPPTIKLKVLWGRVATVQTEDNGDATSTSGNTWIFLESRLTQGSL